MTRIQYLRDGVVQSETIITSRGDAFAKALLESKAIRQALREGRAHWLGDLLRIEE